MATTKRKGNDLYTEVVVEAVGKTILSNFWLKLGCSREELGALRQIAQLFETRKYRTTGRAAALVLTTALMHWDKLEPLVLLDQKYAKDEGFVHRELFQAQTIARKFNLSRSAQVL